MVVVLICVLVLMVCSSMIVLAFGRLWGRFGLVDVGGVGLAFVGGFL